MFQKAFTLVLLTLAGFSTFAGPGDNCACEYDCNIYEKLYAFIDSVDRYAPNKGYTLLGADMAMPEFQTMATELDEAYEIHIQSGQEFEEFVRGLRLEVGRLQLPEISIIKETPEFHIVLTLSRESIEEGMVQVRAPYKRIYFRNIEHYSYSGGLYIGPHKAIEFAINPKFSETGKPIKESYWYHALVFSNGNAYVDRPLDGTRWREGWRKVYFLGKPKAPRTQDLASQRGLCLALCYTPGQTVIPINPQANAMTPRSPYPRAAGL